MTEAARRARGRVGALHGVRDRVASGDQGELRRDEVRRGRHHRLTEAGIGALDDLGVHLPEGGYTGVWVFCLRRS
jgi:hypothetical protein